MLAFAIVALVASAAMGYVIGAAVIAPRDSFLRTKFGIWLLIVGAMSFTTLPPQLNAMSGMFDSLTSGASADAASGVMDMFAWPASLDQGVYITVWIVTTALALLVGMRVWNARKPGWRTGGSNAMDTSAVGRVRGMLPLSDSVEEALDSIARSGIDARGAEQLAVELRGVGRRFSAALPEGSSAVYTLVVNALPPAVANVVTKYLLEGVAESRQS